MLILWLVLLLILIMGLIGAIFGAPYLPTLNKQVGVALDLANLKQGETLLELGCGDGKVLVAAAKRGLKVVGYELNPLLALLSYLRTIKYRKNVKVIWGDYWKKEWPKADAVFVFLIPRFMKKLDKYLISYKHKPIKLVTFAFKVPGKKITEKKAGIFYYVYK